jgi:hypothetical protein
LLLLLKGLLDLRKLNLKVWEGTLLLQDSLLLRPNRLLLLLKSLLDLGKLRLEVWEGTLLL